MTDTTTPAAQRALDPDLTGLPEDALPPGRHLVRAAAEGGFGWVAVRAWLCADDTVVVHPEPDVCVGDQVVPLLELKLHETRRARVSRGRVETLTEVARAAADADVGLIVRIRDGRTCGPIGEILGKGASGPQDLRSRVLAVVPDSRIGTRLRREAGHLPSAVEFTGGESFPARWIRRFLPQIARGAADADHLVLPWDYGSERRVRGTLVPALRRRGGDLWLSGVTPAREGALRGWPVQGLLVHARPPA